MKLNISFSESERDQIMQVVDLVQRLFPIKRTHPPRLKEDGYYHMSLTSPR